MDVSDFPATDFEPPAAVEPEFRDAVRAYIDMHDQIAEASKAMRDMRKRKAELAEVIVEYMTKRGIPGVHIPERSVELKRRESKRLEPLKKEHIMGVLARAVGEAKAEDMLVTIFSHRAVTSKDTLSLTKKRSSSSAPE